MLTEIWFYVVTVLLCTAFPLLMHSYPQWKVYFVMAFVGFLMSGAVLIYLDAKDREDAKAKIAKLAHDLEDAKKETKKQQAAATDAAQTANALAQQLREKTQQIHTAVKEEPQVDGEIREVRLFPWQRQSDRETTQDEMVGTTGILVFANVENRGSSTALANWELNIELPNNRVIKPQKWPVESKTRIHCPDGLINISKQEALDVKSRQTFEKSEERSGVTVWMVRGVPLNAMQVQGSSYTLTARDNIGVRHALERFEIASPPKRCSGFDILD